MGYLLIYFIEKMLTANFKSSLNVKNGNYMSNNSTIVSSSSYKRSNTQNNYLYGTSRGSSPSMLNINLKPNNSNATDKLFKRSLESTQGNSFLNNNRSERLFSSNANHRGNSVSSPLMKLKEIVRSSSPNSNFINDFDKGNVFAVQAKQNTSPKTSFANEKSKITSFKSEIFELSKNDSFSKSISKSTKEANELKNFGYKSTLQEFTIKINKDKAKASNQPSPKEELNMFKKNLGNGSTKGDLKSFKSNISDSSRTFLKTEAKNQVKDTKDVYEARNDIIFNNKKFEFDGKKHDILNLIKSHKSTSESFYTVLNEYSSNNTSNAGNRAKSPPIVLRPVNTSFLNGDKSDKFFSPRQGLSLRQMEKNLQVSKLDMCHYFNSKNKIESNTKLVDFNFNKSQNKIASMIKKLA